LEEKKYIDILNDSIESILEDCLNFPKIEKFISKIISKIHQVNKDCVTSIETIIHEDYSKRKNEDFITKIWNFNQYSWAIK
jgi:hypothetical protein